MSLENFLVRAKRRAVEQFQVRDAWDNLTAEDRHVLVNDVAGLPSAVGDSDISAKQFDYLILKGQLDLLELSASFANCKEKCITIAAYLETLGNVPMVKAEMELILEIQTEEYWTDINPWMLETLRRRLRNLIKLIEGEAKQIVYTDFTDEIGDGTTVALPDAGVGTDKARFQLKVRHFLQSHADHITILKLRRNEQLTPQDLSELERILVEEAVATNDDLTAINDEGGLGLFIRSLVGLERDAAKNAFAGFLQGRNPSANQMEFINIIIDHLTENGAMEPKRLYESPFTDLDDQGVGGLFPQADVLQIVSVLNDVKLKAAA
jgi:type I restriction enzyme R subunit